MEIVIEYNELKTPTSSYEITVPSMWMYLGDKFQKGILFFVATENHKTGLSMALIEHGAKYRPVELKENGLVITDVARLKELHDIGHSPSGIKSFEPNKVTYVHYPSEPEDEE